MSRHSKFDPTNVERTSSPHTIVITKSQGGGRRATETVVSVEKHYTVIHGGRRGLSAEVVVKK